MVEIKFNKPFKIYPIYFIDSNKGVWKTFKASPKIIREDSVLNSIRYSTDFNTMLFLWIISDQNV